MLKIENYEVLGWEHAIRGMRNPKNSWERSDSFVCKEEPMTNEEIDATCGKCTLKPIDKCPYDDSEVFVVGPNDHKLMMTLASGGPVHAKYRRMITVYLDITAPLYWWKEFDTYKVGTVANSCSTMHKIHAKEFTVEDFSFDEDLMDEEIIYDIDEDDDEDYSHIHFEMQVDRVVGVCESLRKMYNHYTKRAKDPDITEAERKHFTRAAKKCWRMLIQLLPTSYNQKRTVMLNYEVLHNIYESRRHHKLDEWHTLCDWIEKLPYSEIIVGEKKDG